MPHAQPILRALGDVAKRLPYPLFLRMFYAQFFLRETLPARRALRRHGLSLLTRDVLRQHKRSEVLCVLGSGPSINRISLQRWRAIARHDTLGLNLWLIHPFVPRFYVFESVHREQPSYPVFIEYFRRRAADYANTLIIGLDFDGKGPQTFTDAPREWRSHMYAALDLPAPARNLDEFAYALQYLKRKGAFRPWHRVEQLFKYCASITAVLTLALKMQYRKVLLCGVDLYDQSYFYQDPERFPETAQLEFAPRERRHAIADPIPWRLPVDQTLMEMKRRFLDPAGVELYVESRSSALWPQMPEVPPELLGEAGKRLSVAQSLSRSAKPTD